MKSISYDGIFKELMDEFPDESIVDFINNLFERNHPRDSMVLKLATESHVDSSARRSDKTLRIGETMYHVELQSGDDSDIALRIFEYSYRAALLHGKTQGDDFLRLDFPRPVVFYLRATGKTPRLITVELNLPDGNTTTFTIPAKHLNEYTLQDLTQDSSVIFAPYYPMLYEGESLKTPEVLKKLESESITIVDRIKSKADSGTIGRKSADLIVKSLEDILENVMLKAKIDQKEVEGVMEAVARKYHLEPLNWREEGRVEGKAKGMREAAMKMLAKGFSIADIQDVTGYAADTLEEMRSLLPN